ncbi:phosphate transport system permease protein PstC [Hydrogenimonas sp.]|nr:phosphate transport system permease protein PstC [Hydrogenimonas sp.]
MIDTIFHNTTRFFAISVLLVLAALFAVLFSEAKPAMEAFGLDFIINSKWAPNMEIFGGYPAIYGSIVSTIIAMLIATPIAIGIAIFLSELTPPWISTPVGMAIELLAAIPSIIYGMWGLFYLAPVLRDIWGGNGLGLMTAGIVLSIMILPFMAAITRDAMKTTPEILKESAYGMGATRWEVLKDVVIPYVKSGIIGSIILALGRAVGETMAVTFVMGNSHKVPSSIFQPATSIPVTLANEFTEADTDLYYSSLFYLALILLVISFTVIAVAKFWFLRNLQEQRI